MMALLMLLLLHKITHNLCEKSAPFLGHRAFLHKGILKKGGIREGKGRVVLKVDIAQTK